MRETGKGGFGMSRGMAAALALGALAVWPRPAAFAEEEGAGKAAAPVPAEAPKTPQVPPQGETIFGQHMMTQQEMADHRARMHAAKTPEEREKIRQQHHQQMVERAKQRGISLPEQPLGPPAGAGRGMGLGRGMGAQGMGRGMGPPAGAGGATSPPGTPDAAKQPE
jgi:hypothetical protein